MTSVVRQAHHERRGSGYPIRGKPVEGSATETLHRGDAGSKQPQPCPLRRWRGCGNTGSRRPIRHRPHAPQKSPAFLSNFPCPNAPSSHTQDLFNHLHRKFLIKNLGMAYPRRGGLVHEHRRTHVLQVVPTRFWKVMHFFASTFQERTPVALLSSKGSKLRIPLVMAPVPHFGTHLRHALQNSVMPESTAPMCSSGRSVIILEIRQRAPTLGLINRPCLPSWPRPASMAIGMLRPMSLAAGIALYPRPRINSAIIHRVGAILA